MPYGICNLDRCSQIKCFASPEIFATDSTFTCMIDALILLDSSGQHVTTRSYKSGGVDSSHRFRLPTKLMTLIAADSGCQSFPAVSDDDDSNTRFVTISRDGIYLIGMVSDCENIDNILILSMLDSAHSIMRKYYGCAITDSVLKSNFTTVYLVC